VPLPNFTATTFEFTKIDFTIPLPIATAANTNLFLHQSRRRYNSLPPSTAAQTGVSKYKVLPFLLLSFTNLHGGTILHQPPRRQKQG
jgi:hypothetical protein